MNIVVVTLSHTTYSKGVVETRARDEQETKHVLMDIYSYSSSKELIDRCQQLLGDSRVCIAIIDFLKEKRIEKAQAMLLYSEEKIQVISDATGFTNIRLILTSPISLIVPLIYWCPPQTSLLWGSSVPKGI
ncbi:hypothetical protein GCM10008018_56180 [Paenibacillus marchantiophytorum]|uniref:Uncharacterized protein n=1 Tax=Paenibacillus marchantiophytorum TaxID=1619310 RepID=A0ABQ1F8S4_9BACL|nr:helix-turn-helix transcriptional regulator [Paenibacillus marchantiophytorum]GGA02881.1 hypothetical protein GCM10008018_56180 [Paenibacillus marchantiophytorum]